jgi:hypothetical protein
MGDLTPLMPVDAVGEAVIKSFVAVMKLKRTNTRKLARPGLPRKNGAGSQAKIAARALGSRAPFVF